ncbi:hypothetical protein ACEPPN_003134 [Leptodophora sp. 'Broadleaf-Isolate-01']
MSTSIALAMDLSAEFEIRASRDDDVTKPTKTDLSLDDQAGLMAIGKKPVFERKFNFWTALCITACATGAWEGIGAAIFQALKVGGPVALVWGYVICAVTMICVAASLAELASIWPSSGAQYHWTAELAPKRLRAELSWLVGWLAFTGAGSATILCGMGVSMQIQAFAMIANPDYAETAQRWHVYMIYLVISAIYFSVNTFGVRLIHPLNAFGGFLHIFGYLVIIITLAITTKDKHTAKYVFTDFSNNSGWPSSFVAFCVGMMTSMNGFPSIEIAAHFAEEIKHASRSLPRAMFWTVCLNAVFIFPWIILVLYCIGDLNEVLADPVALLSPLTIVFKNATGSTAGSICLNSLGIYAGFMGGLDSLGSCARSIWAMSRDEAFPERFRRVHPKLQVPVWCIIAVSIPQTLIGIIYIWNTTAFYGVTSAALALLTISYSIPIGLFLFSGRRNPNIVLGEWNCGRLGYFINTVAFFWLIFISIFLCFPIYYPANVKSMNYASLIIGSLSMVSLATYFLYARGRFNGPVVEICLGMDPAEVGPTKEKATSTSKVAQMAEKKADEK